AFRFAARQVREPAEVYRFGAPRFEVGIEKREVRELVLCVVVDVLRHVFVEDFERFRVGRVAAAARHLAVLHAAELVVLLPEVGLEDLGGGEESQDRRSPLLSLVDGGLSASASAIRPSGPIPAPTPTAAPLAMNAR